jgi:hypothetical protein
MSVLICPVLRGVVYSWVGGVIYWTRYSCSPGGIPNCIPWGHVVVFTVTLCRGVNVDNASTSVTYPEYSVTPYERFNPVLICQSELNWYRLVCIWANENYCNHHKKD